VIIISTKSVLVSFAGYPITPSSLLPDNGLANLAGSLIENGHETVILDYGTVDTIQKLKIPDDCIKQAYDFGGKIIHSMGKEKTPEKSDIEHLNMLKKEIRQIEADKIKNMAYDIVEEIKSYNPDFVGLKLWNGDGFKGSLMIAEQLKKRSKIPIFAGGAHVDWFKERIFQATKSIDALVYSEGEETIVSLANYVSGESELETIPNLIYLKGKKAVTTPMKRIENLDKLAFPVYDEEVYPSMHDNQKIKILVVDESRGCPYSCAFCTHSIKSGKEWRQKSASKIVDDLEMMIRRYNTNVFVFAGSTTPPTLLKQMATKMLDKKLNVDYAIFGNIKSSKPEDYELLKKSGCYSIFFGLESGNRTILKNSMNKDVSVEKIKSVLTESKKSGIYTIASVIFPAPHETDNTKKDTLELLFEIKPDSVPVQFPGLIPGSEWTEYPDRYNFKFDKEEYLNTLMDYKIRLLFPPIFWDPLPYDCDGKDFFTLLKESTDFLQKLESNGIITAIPQDLALIIKHLGVSSREFQERYKPYFFQGDYEKILRMVETVNFSISKR